MPKITKEMARWLDLGWSAVCTGCRHVYRSHDKVGETHCPRCGDIPTMASAFAAIATLPGPANLDEVRNPPAKRKRK